MSRARRFSASDWISLGHRALAEGGTEAVKLEALCKAAGLTRGSFYHHFRDHAAYLVALTEAWAEQNTTRLVAALEGLDEAGAEALNDMALDLDFALEVGIRELARRVPEVARLVSETDATRLSVLTDLARARFGLARDRAADLAFIEYAAFCGMMLIGPGPDRETQRRLSRTLDGMMRGYAAQPKADRPHD
jgi:AcrR family transcriptional regulator